MMTIAIKDKDVLKVKLSYLATGSRLSTTIRLLRRNRGKK